MESVATALPTEPQPLPKVDLVKPFTYSAFVVTLAKLNVNVHLDWTVTSFEASSFRANLGIIADQGNVIS